MSVVYRAIECESGRVVALKMLQLFYLRTPEMLRRFEAEVRAIANLDHPNIIPMYEVGQHDGLPYFSMKLAERGSLAGNMARCRANPRAAAGLLAKLARALFYAHQRGVIHRDLKPGNILLDAGHEPYIADFGIAKITTDAGHDSARPTVALGTPNYLAPELAGGPAGEVTTAVDIYGLGAILYELLTGNPPATGATPFEVIENLSQGPPPSPRAVNPAIDRDLATLCLKCLARNPADRYASAAALADDLDNYLAGRPVLASPPGLAGQVWRFCLRQPVISSLAASVVLLLAAVAAVSINAALNIAAQRDRAVAAERNAQDELYNSLLMQVRFGRQTGQAGHRFEGLESLRAATRLRASDEIRSEAAALLSLTDLRPARVTTVRASPNYPVAFDPALGRYLVCTDRDDALALRRLDDHAELARYPGTGATILSLSPFSADGRYIASRHLNGFIRVWDTRAHRLAFELPGRVARNRPYQSTRFWFGCAFSRHGRLAAIELADGGYTLHDTLTGSELARSATPAAPLALAFDRTGQKLAVADRGLATVEIRDPLTGATLRALEHPAAVSFLDWSPAGDTLAVGCNDGGVYLWNAATGARRRVLDAHRNRVTHFAFSPDGRLLATTSQDKKISLWDAEAGKRLVSYSNHGHEPVLRFSRDGARLVSTNFLPQATLFEIVTGDAVCRTLTPPGRSNDATVTAAVDFSPDARWLATSTRKAVFLWDLDRRRLAATLRPGPETETSALFTPDGSALLVATRNTGLARHPFDPGNPAAPLAPPVMLTTEQGCTLSDFGLNPRHAILVSRDKGTVHLWPVGASLATPGPGAADDPPGRPDAADDPPVALENAAQRSAGIPAREMAQNAAHPRRFRVQNETLSAALSADGAILATTSAAQSSRPASKIVHLWDTATGAKLRELDGGEAGLVRFSTDGRRILASGRRAFSIWDAATGERLPGAPDLGNFLSFSLSPDGRYLCASGAARVILFQGASYAEPVIQLSLDSERNSGSRTTFSPDGRLLAVHESDGVIHLWDMPALRAALATLGLDWEDPQKK
jgi:WD40 repeat protein